MFNKNSNKALWIVFAVLLAGVILIFSSESTKNERSFRKDIVSIDTSSVSSFSIFPKSKPGQELKFLRDGNNWFVSITGDKNFKVPQFKIKNIFNELLKIQPKRVAARSKAKWSEYQVDSSATRVVVNEDGSEVLNLIIGKFAFQQPRSMSTFVRLMDEKDVYEVDGFLDMSFNKDINSFRDETVIKSDKSKWNKLTFTSAENEPFEIIKTDDVWMVDGVKSDSVKTDKAISTLSRITSTDYVELSNDELLPPEYSKLVIELEEGEPIVVTGYKSDEQYIIKTSLNPESYFDGNKIGSKIFITKDSLF